MADNPANRDLLEKWKEVLREYERVTEKGLSTAPPNTAEEMEAKFNELDQADRSAVVKSTIRSVLKAGRFAVEAAPSIFQPAASVFTALLTLTDIVDNYRSNFTPPKAREKLKDVEGHLRRMEGYLENIERGVEVDSGVKDVIMTMLTGTLSLCTIYNKLARDARTPTGIVKNLLKAAVFSDGGIAPRLKAMEDASKTELNNNVAALRNSNIYTQDSKVRKAKSEKLKKLLDVGGKEKYWTGRQASLGKDHIATMGDWLPELPGFKEWAKTDGHSKSPVLWISAPSGYGKTHLCSRAIHFVEKQQKIPVSVAWYFFPEGQGEQKRSSTKGENTKREEAERVSLLDALRALVWQLSARDAAFQDFVVKKLEKTPQGLSKPYEIWNSLINGFAKKFKKESAKPQKIQFLVLDGLGALNTRDRQAMSKILRDTQNFRKRATQFRVLLSGNQRFSLNLHPSVSSINLETDFQRSDAEAFIKFKLQGTLNPLRSRSDGYSILVEVQGNLAWKFRGNYHWLKEWLQEVESSSNRGLSYLEELRRENPDDLSIITKRKLETLDRKLENDDIAVLNELIVCMAHWRFWPTVEMLDAYLSLRLGRRFKPSIGSQLDKFERLAYVEDGLVFADDLYRFFLSGQELNIERFEQETCNQEQDCKENKLVPKSMFPFFNQLHWDNNDAKHLKAWIDTHTIERSVVYFNTKEVKLETILFFLRTICNETTRKRPEFEILCQYPAIFLPAHIKDLEEEDLRGLDDLRKEELGRLIYETFVDEKVVKAWMPKGDIDFLLWLKWEQDVTGVVRCLNSNSSVKNGFLGRVKATEAADDKVKIEAGGKAAVGNNIAGVEILSTRESDNAVQDPSKTDNESETFMAKVTRSIVENLSGGNDTNTKAAKKSSSDGPRDVQLHELLQAPMKVVASQWLQESKWDALKTWKFLTKLFFVAYGSKYNSKEKSEPGPHDSKDNSGEKAEPEEMVLRTALEDMKKNNEFPEEDEAAIGAVEEVPAHSEADGSDGSDGSDESDEADKSDEAEKGVKSSDAVRAAGKWAFSLLGIPETQPRRNEIHEHRLAETFMGLSNEAGWVEAEWRYVTMKGRDPFDIKGRLGLIQASSNRKNRQRQALQEVMEIRNNIQSSSFEKAHHDTWVRELARFWFLCDSTGNAKAAFTACRDLSEEFPGEFPEEFTEEQSPLDKAHFWIMRQKKLDASFETICMKGKSDGRSLLSRLFCLHAQSNEFHEKFHAAAKDRPGLVLETYEDAIKACNSRLDKVLLQYHYGMALSRCGRLPEGLVAWENVMDQVKDSIGWSDGPKTSFEAFSLVAKALGSGYLEIRNRPECPTPNIEKLEHWKDDIDGSYKDEINYLALALARIYDVLGQKQKAVASVQTHMVKAFDFLKDDRDDNDWRCYFMLAEALMSLSDDDNASAAWSLIVNAPDVDRLCDLEMQCAGDCDCVWKGSEDLQKDIFICKTCPHVRFERDCYELLKKNGLKNHVCSAKHSFLKVCRRTRVGIVSLEFNRVLMGRQEILGRREMKIEHWLHGLRRRYGIPSPGRLSWPRRTTEPLAMTKWRLERKTETLIKVTKQTRIRLRIEQATNEQARRAESKTSGQKSGDSE